MLKIAVGQSEDPSAVDSVQEILAQIHETLSDIQPQAGILFCSADFDYTSIAAAIRRAYPGMEMAGCTTDGETSSVYGFSGDSAVLMVFASDVIEIRAGAGKEMSRGGKNAGGEAADSILKTLREHKGEQRFAIVFSDPLNAGVSDFSAGFNERFGENFPLIGAAAAAHSKKRTTYQFYNDEILTDSVVLLLFAGPVAFSFGVQGGHAPMGGREKITSYDKNVLYKIGGEPALNYFTRYIGDQYSLFMNYCLAVFEEGQENFYVRSAPFVDVEKGSVTLNGVVSGNAWIQIGTADKNTCVESCSQSIRAALDSYPGAKPEAALLFSCAGRKMIMGTQIVRETRIVRNLLGDMPFCGFYSYGEFCPLEKGGKSMFHGTTFVTLLIGL